MLIHSSYKKIKKDYERKKWHNPFFRQRQGSKVKPNSLLLAVLAFIFLFIIILYFFFAASFWQISSLEVQGLTLIPKSELENLVWAQSVQRRYIFFKENNIFLFKGDDLVKNIMDNYNFAGVKIEKKIPNILKIIVNERPYAFIFQEGSSFFYASPDAYIIKEKSVSEEDKKKYFSLENRDNHTMINEKNKLTLSLDYLNFIFNLNSLLKIKSDLVVEKFIIDQELNTVKLKMVNGPIALFNIKDAAETQLNYLILVKKEKIKDNFSKTNYIDLRYGDRVFINPDFK